VNVSGLLAGCLRRVVPDLSRSAYPSPEQARRQVAELVERHPERARLERIGTSREGRSVDALCLSAGSADGRPRLLVTAHIHACEFVGSYVARALVRHLLEAYGRDAVATRVLDEAAVWVAPQLNPDGAERVWRKRGVSGLAWARFTASGVDPNRNFPFVEALDGPRAWNSARAKPGSAWYRGPEPLSEPECAALARLAGRERFCGALNFHSFGGVVYMPEPLGPDAERVREALAAFQGPFQAQQRHLRYRPVPERRAAIVAQLDAFLLYGLGTPSVTVEVSRPGAHLLQPWHAANLFWWANPPDPERWAANDVPAAAVALDELRTRTGGAPLTPAHPELADAIPDASPPPERPPELR